jgi:hypothetical protein
MGAGYHDPSPAKGDSDFTTIIPVEEQCGIIACSVFSGKSVADVIKASKETNLYDRIAGFTEYKYHNERDCLYCKDIRKLMSALGHGIQDCRFCTFKRTTDGQLPFPKYINGIVALKLDVNGDLTHWIAFKDGRLIDGEDEFKTTKQLKKKYKGFDGYGFKLSIWRKEDFDILENTMSVFCKSCTVHNGAICKNCSRKSFCIEKRIAEVVKINSVMDEKEIDNKECGSL